MGDVVVKDVPADLKRDFKAACRENNTTMTDVLTQVMRQVTGNQEGSAPPLNRECKVTLRLSDEELDALLERQAQEGDDYRTTTAINAMRRGLGYSPILNRELITTLRESNRELTAIGRNLNQVARALNIDPRQGESIRYEAIQKLVAAIDEHRKTVADTVRKSLGRSL